MAHKLTLRTLQLEDKENLLQADQAFKAHYTEMAFAFNLEQSSDFAAYLAMLEDWSQGKNLPDQFVPSTFFVGVVDGEIVGRLSLRHELNDFLSRVGGHIGYAVVPQHQGKGYATEMLRQALSIAADLGISPVLVTCDEGNLASQRVIEKLGGVFDCLAMPENSDIPKRRYWIETTPTAQEPTAKKPAPKKPAPQVSKDPLHGVTLEMIVNALVDHYGWEELGHRVHIRCFNNNPSVKSSLKFLRRTPWARKEVEGLYLSMIACNQTRRKTDKDDSTRKWPYTRSS